MPSLTARLPQALLCACLLASLPLKADVGSRLAELTPGVLLVGERIDLPEMLAKLYEGHPSQRLWSPQGLASLNQAIAASADDGLQSRDYYATSLAREELDADTRDLLASAALMRLAYSLRFGKLNPALFDPDWNYSRRLANTDPLQWLRQTIARGEIPISLAAIRPTGDYYVGLRKALARYRAFDEAGGWKALPAGPTLKPGMEDPRIPALRQRLAAEGIATGPGSDDTYDPTLLEAISTFQAQRGLTADGALGAGTLAALNVPVRDRIDNLRLNMERLRWVFRDFTREFVVVNIAGYRAAYVVDGQPRWTGRVIVGKPFRQTPLFKADLQYLEFNPTWTVPPTILKEDMLPKLRHDRALLKQKNLEVVDAEGQVVDPASVDWQRFRYALRQKPGAENALGRVKFMFPNTHAIYLHDTPARELFNRTERAFSSGCIRIERPLDLAEALLDDPKRWNRAALEALVNSERTQRVNLPRRVPVMLMYLTAFPAPDGSIRFQKDFYGRDPARQRALDGPFMLSALDQ